MTLNAPAADVALLDLPQPYVLFLGDTTEPDVIVVCHEPGRERMVGHAQYALPRIEETIDLNLRLGGRTNPAIRCGGISLNTSRLSESAAGDRRARQAHRHSHVRRAPPGRGGAGR